MKLKFFIVSLFGFISIASQAQFPAFSFGLRAAPQISWMRPNTDNYSGDGPLLGFSWGFIAEKNFTENHSIATGFNIHFIGGKLQFPQGDSGTMSRKYNLKYFEIPVTLKMRTGAIKGVRYFGQIGLGTGFRIGSKATDLFKSDNGSTITGKKYNYDNTSFLRESLIIGVGGEYKLKGGPSLGGGLMFNNGFTDILTATKPVKENSFVNAIELDIFVLF